MLHALDNLLRQLFLKTVPTITAEEQVRFQPPDQAWRVLVGAQDRNLLNVYLIDVRENRRLRSNERLRETDKGIVRETPAPVRMDCHYLITAWSPGVVTLSIEPTLDEHTVLYGVAAALTRSPLSPQAIYAPAPAPVGANELPAAAELPVTIMPVEGFSKYAEFWGTMGSTHPWKPAVYAVVTIPIVIPQREAGFLVTTRITTYHPGSSAASDEWIEIGGTTRSGTNQQPLANAWVGLETTAGAILQTTESDAQGRFLFEKLQRGNYQLRVRALGKDEIVQPIQVPSSSGVYDLSFP